MMEFGKKVHQVAQIGTTKKMALVVQLRNDQHIHFVDICLVFQGTRRFWST